MTELREISLTEVTKASRSLAVNRVYRDMAIKAARSRGATVAEIANAAGMSRQGIAKILQRVDNSVDKV